MGVASLVIGIMSLLISFLPFCGTFAIIPACVGLGLGIADLVVKSKRDQGKGMAIAGLHVLITHLASPSDDAAGKRNPAPAVPPGARVHTPCCCATRLR